MLPLQISVLVTILVAAVYAGRLDQRPKSCEEFTKGSIINDSQAVGTWYLMRHRDLNAPDDDCLQFYAVDEKERKDLSQNIGKYVTNVTWESVTLKMQVPCSAVPSNRSRSYYLERRENGYYHSIQMPTNTVNLTSASFSRHWMSLKHVDGNKYLGLMDCDERFVFFMDTKPSKQIDDLTLKMIEAYWPLEFD